MIDLGRGSFFCQANDIIIRIRQRIIIKNLDLYLLDHHHHVPLIFPSQRLPFIESSFCDNKFLHLISGHPSFLCSPMFIYKYNK